MRLTTNIHDRINQLNDLMAERAKRNTDPRSAAAAEKSLQLAEKLRSNGVSHELQDELSRAAAEHKNSDPMLWAYMDVIAYHCSSALRQQKILGID
jgi:hypothetical protein